MFEEIKKFIFGSKYIGSKRNLYRSLKIMNLDIVEGYKMGIKTKHCCQLMAKFVDDPRVKILYFPYCRGYFLGTSSIGIQLLYNCPFCGCELPKVLWDAWELVLKNEYGIDAYDDEQKSKIPEEFKSDEWWKKRNL